MRPEALYLYQALIRLRRCLSEVLETARDINREIGKDENPKGHRGR